jgi:hypothetical protein
MMTRYARKRSDSTRDTAQLRPGTPRILTRKSNSRADIMDISISLNRFSPTMPVNTEPLRAGGAQPGFGSTRPRRVYTPAPRDRNRSNGTPTNLPSKMSYMVNCGLSKGTRNTSTARGHDRTQWVRASHGAGDPPPPHTHTHKDYHRRPLSPVYV